MNTFILRFLSFMLVASMFLCTIPCPVYANDDIQPLYLHIQDWAHYFSINPDNGYTTCYGAIATRELGHTVRIVLYLQRLNNGTWETVKRWEKSTDSITTSLTKYCYVEHGYLYRLNAYGYVCNENNQVIDVTSGYTDVYY